MRMLFCALLWLAQASVFGLDFAGWDEKSREFDLNNHVYYYVEEYNEQQPHEALELLQKDYFTRTPSARLSLGYTAKAVWIAVPFAGSPEKTTRLILEITSLIDSIQLSHMNERGLIIDSYVTGRDFPLASRPIANHSFVFPLAVERSAKGYVLIRLISQGSMLVPLRLTVDSEFHANDHIEQMIFGLYFGIMLVMVLYNFFLYASTRERSYAFYVFYILFFLLFQFALWGFLHELILPDSPRLAKYLLPVFLHLATLFQLLFATQFFQARGQTPRLYRISGYLSFATFFSLVTGGLLPYRWFITVGIVTGTSAALLIFFMALLLYLKKLKAARFFLIAYTTLIAGVVLLTLRNLGIINYSIISTYSAQIGSALEVILLSLALGDRINLLRDEKEKTQKAAIERERDMSRSFARFVPQKFLELAGETDFTRLELGKSSTREMTVLFSDIRRFTALTETMSPEESFRFLNSYLSRMGPIIREHGGFIDKFIGDAIMALFPNDPQSAVLAALAMRAELTLYNEHRAAQGYAPIDIGIGIHTGNVRLGTIGENERWEGTVIGDTVNLASRIGNLSSTFDAPVVVSQAVSKGLDTAIQQRELDTIRVKGKKQAVTIYEIISHAR